MVDELLEGVPVLMLISDVFVFLIFHSKILDTMEFIHTFGADEGLSPLYSFCKKQFESFSQLFYICTHSNNFWTQISSVVWEIHVISLSLSQKIRSYCKV